MKKILTGLGIAVLVSSLTACGRLNTHIDEQIEEVGSDLTEAPVDVKRVKIRLGGGSGQITGLSVANPEGYVTANAFKIDLLRLNIGLVASLVGPVIVLDELVIVSPVLTLELDEQGGSNLKDLADNVRRKLEQADSKSAQEQKKPDDTANGATRKPVRIAVRKLVIEGVTFNLRRSDGTLRSGTLPTIELSDVGGEEGKTPAGLGAVVIVSMVGEMLKQAVAHKLAEGIEFDAEKVLSFLDQRLNLSSEQRVEMRVVAKNISQGLNKAIEMWVTQGFVDIDSLSRDIEPFAEQARDALQDVLDSNQMQEFENFLANLDAEAIDAIRTELVGRLAETLGLNDEQIVQLRPILRQHLEQLGELLSRISSEPDRSIEGFKADYDVIRSGTREKLKDVLDGSQMKALTQRQDELREKIQQFMFP